MTTQTPVRTTPYFVSPWFFGGNQPYPQTSHTVTITQEEFKHDMAVIDFWADDIDNPAYRSGMPMKIAYGRPANHRLFYGYVNHALRHNSHYSQDGLLEHNLSVIYSVGASWLLKQQGTRTWQNYTAPQVVEEIAQQFGLDSSVVPHSMIWPTLQMAGESYWVFCCRLAKKIGYTFYCNGVQLVFKPRTTDPSIVTSPVYSFDYKHDAFNMMQFQPTLGANSPSGGLLRNRQLASINPKTNTVMYSQANGILESSVMGLFSDAAPFSYIEHFMVDSQQESNTKLFGAAYNNQMYLQASATAQGNSLICPGSLVSVQNVNGSQNGVWWIEKAIHRFTPNTYELEMRLGRDSRGQTVFVGSLSNVVNLPTAQIVNKIWVAA